MATLDLGRVVGEGIASGGTEGQYLRKKSATDYDTEFSTIQAGEVSGAVDTTTDQTIGGNKTFTGGVQADKGFFATGFSSDDLPAEVEGVSFYRHSTLLVNRIAAFIKSAAGAISYKALAIGAYVGGKFSAVFNADGTVDFNFNVTAPTQATSDSSTKVATTALVANKLAAYTIPNDSVTYYKALKSDIKTNRYPFKNDSTLTYTGLPNLKTDFQAGIFDIRLYGADPTIPYSVQRVLRKYGTTTLVSAFDVWRTDTYQTVCSFYAVDYTEPASGYETITLVTMNNSSITGKVKIKWSGITSNVKYAALDYGITGLDKACILPPLLSEGKDRRWENKKWYAIGDSITAQNIYPWYLNCTCLFNSYYNAGQSGKGMKYMTDTLVTEALTKYHLVTVFAGTNDYGGNTALGTMSDTSSTESFYGYCKKVIETIMTAKPTIKLAFFTPLKRGVYESQPVYPAANSAGHYLDDYVNAIIEVCEYYSIPVLNLFKVSQFSSLTLTTYTNDNLHPNITGGDLLARSIQGFIETL